MKNDSYSATWVSHSSISDFIKCPKAYYFHNVYKDPNTRHKIALINPPMALGQSVHSVLEALSTLKAEDRLKVSLLDRYDEVWKEISGKRGGFKSQDEENVYKERGRLMIQHVIDHPGPIANKALTLHIPDPSFPLPHFQLSIEDNIILSGKIDWMEYVPETNSVHIIDFKTGKYEEDPSSLQLAIYCLLVQNLQKRNIHKISYWYLESKDELKQMELPDLDESKKSLIEFGRRIKKAKAIGEFNCPKNGCYACKPYIAIINGDAEYVGTAGGYQDVYII
ncbi:MAG: PD-(D/E)XK nuclease family protein [Microgenomates group bacterium]|jgi:CRISPR/Cas system-associated exonuclease Cas4 (RecB family)